MKIHTQQMYSQFKYKLLCYFSQKVTYILHYWQCDWLYEVCFSIRVSKTCFNSKATSTNDTNYSCCIKGIARSCLTNHMGFISHHIMLLVINRLRQTDRHRHTDTQTHTYIHTSLTKSISRNHALAHVALIRHMYICR